MPQQKATSFADDLAALEAGSFADDLAAVTTQQEKPAKPQGFLDRMLADNPALPAMLRGAQGALRLARQHPVEAGAITGGLLAAPVTGGGSIPAAMAAAGLGSAGGAGLGIAARQLDTGVPEDPRATVKTMAGEGLAGAAGQGVGAGLAKLAGKGGKLVYKASLRPSMGLQREFGDVAETGLREGAAVSERGANKVLGKLKANSATAGKMIADAQAAGAPGIPASEVTPKFKGVLDQATRQLDLGRPDPRGDVWKRVMAFNGRHPGDIPLSRAQELKGEAQDLASRAYRAADKGGPMTDLAAEGDKAMASGLREGIERRVPGIDTINARSQELIGLTRALEDATRRNVPGVGSIRTLLGDFAPSLASRGGIALDRAGQSQIPAAAFRTALIALMGGQE